MFIHALGAKCLCLNESTFVQFSLGMTETMTCQIRDLLATALGGN